MVVSTVASNVRRLEPGGRLLGALLGIALSFVFSACAGSSIDDDDDSSNPVTPDAFVDEATRAICGNITNCCADSGFALDRAACEGYVRGFVDNTTPEGTIWDSDAAGRCIVALGTVARACDANAGDTESCTRIRRGTLPEGAACTEDDQCADIGGEPAWCDSDGLSPGTVCVAPPPEIRRGFGDGCNQTCTDTSCTANAAPGTTSLATCYVEDRLVCDFDLGECVPAPALGEPCPDYYCAPGAYCPYDTMVCVATQPNGSSCEFSDECSAGNCLDLVCAAPSIASQAICTGQ